MSRAARYQDNAARQRAYRERKRNAMAPEPAQRALRRELLRSLPEAHGISRETLRLCRCVLDADPSLAPAIEAGTLRIFTAAVDLGLAHPRTSVRTDDVRSAVEVLRRHYTADQILVALLMRGDLRDDEATP